MQAANVAPEQVVSNMRSQALLSASSYGPIRWAGSPGRVSIQCRCAAFAGRWRPAYYRLPQRIRNAARDANHHSTLSILQSIQRIGGRISPAPELGSGGARPEVFGLVYRSESDQSRIAQSRSWDVRRQVDETRRHSAELECLTPAKSFWEPSLGSRATQKQLQWRTALWF
jgi:hypothetical protein